jgi:hypothetical protein
VWILELILELKLELILPFLDAFTSKISDYKNDSAIRPVSKTCLFLSKWKTIQLSENQETKIIVTCLDWLIQDENVAAKAYSMRALYNFSKNHTLSRLSQSFFSIQSSSKRNFEKTKIKLIYKPTNSYKKELLKESSFKLISINRI